MKNIKDRALVKTGRILEGRVITQTIRTNGVLLYFGVFPEISRAPHLLLLVFTAIFYLGILVNVLNKLTNI